MKSESESIARTALGKGCFFAGLGAALSLTVGVLAAADPAGAAARDIEVFLGTESGGAAPAGSDRLISVAEERGAIPVIVRLKTDFAPEGELSLFAAANQRAAISNLQGRVLGRVPEAQNVKTFETVPMIAMWVGPDGVEALLDSPYIESITEDIADPPALSESTTILRAKAYQNRTGYKGQGFTVAVLDTGYDPKHPAFKDKVQKQACFSSTTANSTSACPGGASSATGKKAAKYCDLGASGCDHGTHVAGIAVGSPGGANKAYKGVAPKAILMPIQVFSVFSSSYCGGTPCALAYVSDQISALEKVYDWRKKQDIASVNMSLGGGLYSSHCDGDSRKPIIDNLKSKKIAVVISSGNSGSTGSVGAPGCISSAITVGSTTKSDVVASYSNHASLVDLLATGSSIAAPVPVKSYGTKSGTSMAAPHVAGGWALLRSQFPDAKVNKILKVMKCRGKAIVHDGIKKKRINIDKAGLSLETTC